MFLDRIKIKVVEDKNRTYLFKNTYRTIIDDNNKVELISKFNLCQIKVFSVKSI